MPIRNEMRGYDTECTSDGVTRIVSFNDRTEYRPEGFTFNDFMSFLFEPKKLTKPIMVYNVKYEANAILRTLPKVVCHKLWNNVTVNYKGMQITLIPGKRISFIPYPENSTRQRIELYEHKNRVSGKSLFDVASFLDYSSLEKASAGFLGKTKMNKAYDWVKEMKKCNTINAELNELDSHQEMVCAYCQSDAALTLELAEKLKENYAKIGIPFNRPMSPANVLKSWLGKTKNYPTISREPENLSTETAAWYERSAFESYHGGLFLTRQRGVFYDVWDVDLTAAYPEYLRKLPNWKNGVFVKPLHKEDYYSAEYGWYLCEFDCEFIPYVLPMNDKIVEIVGGEEIEIETTATTAFYVTGKRTAWITALEYRWLIKNNFKVKWLDGVIWLERTEEYDPPFAWITDFFKERKRLKKLASDGDEEAEMMQQVLKITMNSAYGITAQRKPRYTKYTNFYYSSYTTAPCRCSQADLLVAEDADWNVIQIATDGGILKEIPTQLKITEKMGDWKLEHYDKVLVVGNGIKQSFTKKGTETRARGVTNERDFDLLGTINKNLDKDYLSLLKRRPVGLGELLQTRKMRWTDLNVFRDFERKINVNGDKNRKWSREYKDWRDFLANPTQSKAFTVKQISER